MFTVGHSRIVSTGTYIPDERITSREIFEQFDSKNLFDIPYDWLERTTGIKERRAAPVSLKPSDMGSIAAINALEKAGIKPTQIDAVIYSGMVRDHIEPSTAHIVQHKIGASNAIAFDISNACLGFMSAIHVMDSFIATGQARLGIVVTGEQGFRYAQKACDVLSANPGDRNLFNDLAVGLTLGDAGAAMVIGPKRSPESGFMGFMVQSAGQFHDLCVCGNNGENGPLITKMSLIAKETTYLVGPMYDELMRARLKWHPSELHRYIPHQVGLKSIRKHAEVARVSLDIIPVTVDYLGNVISATIPIILDLLSNSNQVKEAHKLYLSGTGSGICIEQAGLIWDAA